MPATARTTLPDSAAVDASGQVTNRAASVKLAMEDLFICLFLDCQKTRRPGRVVGREALRGCGRAAQARDARSEFEPSPHRHLGLVLERLASTEMKAIALCIADQPVTADSEVVGSEVEVELPVGVIEDRAIDSGLLPVGGHRHPRRVAKRI